MFLPNDMHTLLADNITALQQACALLQSLTPAQYAQANPICFNSSIGGHLRHALDHYVSFNAGLDSGRIDYEARARDTRLERERDYALASITSTIARLNQESASLHEFPIQVRLENQTNAWAPSSIRRELQFLLSHTIHHWALVAVCARSLGVPPPADFGIAPSTLRHHAAEKSRLNATAR